MGRPSKFNENLTQKILELAEQGKTIQEIADFVGIGETTLRVWMTDKLEFRVALKEARDAADQLVEASLYRRAVGYKDLAPDTTAAIFWLKNRRPHEWRDQSHVVHGGNVALTDKELNTALEEELKALGIQGNTGRKEKIPGETPPA